MKVQNFGKLRDGRRAGLYILTNTSGTEVTVTDYGATLVSVVLPDRNGKLRDIVLGHDKVSDYEVGHGSIGATVGRVANRIGNASFELNGKTYELTNNDGPNTLHGGTDSYSKRLWQTKLPFSKISTLDVALEFRESMNDGGSAQWSGNLNGDSVTFVLDSPDGDQRFPGDLNISVTYTLTECNELRIEYKAVSNQDTPVNLTNHSYFNLNGDASGSVLNQECMVRACSFTPCDMYTLTTGEIRSVEGTPMDFRESKRLGQDIAADDEQLRFGNGYDHNFVLDGKGIAATLYSQDSGIKMTVETDMPGMQLYTGNYLDDPTGKRGAVYEKYSGVCFETQFWPDSVNKDNFPGGILKADEEFTSCTTYKFEVI